jgi:O-antigen ligase
LLEVSILNSWQIYSLIDVGLRVNENFDAITTARLTGLALLLTLYIVFTKDQHKKEYDIIIISFITLIPLIYLSQTRQVIASIAFLLAIIFVKNRKTLPLWVKISFILLIIIIFAFLNDFVNDVLFFQSRRLAIWEFNRFETWELAIKEIQNNPILGIGWAGFENKYKIWPHNIILEAYLSLTIVGFFGITILILKTLQKLLNSPNLNFLFIGLLYLLIVSQVSADLARNSMIFLFLPSLFYNENAK